MILQMASAESYPCVENGNPSYEDAYATALETALDITKNSRIIQKEKFDQLPRLHLNDLEIGDYLGSGAFSDVYAAAIYEDHDDYVSVKAMDSNENGEHEDKPHISSEEISEDKYFKYAIKAMSPEVMEDNSKFLCGTADLVIEMHLLSCLDHPNIVKIRGISSAWFSTEESIAENPYFFIMDKLKETLDDKFTTWEENCKKLRDKPTAQKDMLTQRLNVAMDLASAMSFLQERDIIYRDLKPANVGFDIFGNVKIFDFGLARELPGADKQVPGGTYKMTGMVGSPRYMAPEIAKRNTYNTSADVYSFGILLWEMCALQKPFHDCGFKTIERFQKAVVFGNVRPKMLKTWSFSLYDLMKQCWNGKLQDRPDFDYVTSALYREIKYPTDCECDTSKLKKTVHRQRSLQMDRSTIKRQLINRVSFSSIEIDDDNENSQCNDGKSPRQNGPTSFMKRAVSPRRKMRSGSCESEITASLFSKLKQKMLR